MLLQLGRERGRQRHPALSVALQLLLPEGGKGKLGKKFVERLNRVMKEEVAAAAAGINYSC